MSNPNPILKRWMSPPDLAAQLDCVGCTRALVEPALASRWRSYKCCAFQPVIANFYYGALLEDGARLPELTDGVSYQPIGAVPRLSLREKIESTPDEQRGQEHLCAHYDVLNRQCRIWNYRPAECAFYFCAKDDRVERRLNWSTLGFRLEMNLAQMALAQLGFSGREIQAQIDLVNAQAGDLVSLSMADAEDLYRRAWRWVITQSESDVRGWESDEPE